MGKDYKVIKSSEFPSCRYKKDGRKVGSLACAQCLYYKGEIKSGVKCSYEFRSKMFLYNKTKKEVAPIPRKAINKVKPKFDPKSVCRNYTSDYCEGCSTLIRAEAAFNKEHNIN